MKLQICCHSFGGGGVGGGRGFRRRELGESEDTTLVLMDFVMSSHLFPVPLPRPQCANPKRRRGSLNLATSVRPAPLHVSESFSHNGRGSHPELSASLFPISFPRQTKAGGGEMLSESEGERSLPSGRRCFSSHLLFTLPSLRVTQQRAATHKRPHQSAALNQ